MKIRNKILFSVGFTILLAGAFAAGLFFGFSQRPAIEKITNIFNKEISKPPEIDFSPFWTTWNTIRSKYASNDKLDGQQMVWGSIQGLVKSLKDPYSNFLPPQEAKEFQENIRGDFSGVGMEIGARNEIITVIAPLKGTPAYKAGIKAGDKILKIDEKITNDMSVEEAVHLIRGEKGTIVKLTILSKNEEESKEISIARDIIQIPVLDTETKPDGIFVISMYNFSGNSANMFRNALREFILSGNNKLIFDLRGNPGGYLESAVDVASWFLPAGKVVAREKFSDGKETIFRSKGYNIFQDLLMVILVNEGSASASEIVAGALREHGAAKLVGQKTFGKGSVQELIQITPETSLKLTIAKWLTPNGGSISDEGLEPDIAVEITKKDIEAGRDPQMEKAIELLKNWKN